MDRIHETRSSNSISKEIGEQAMTREEAIINLEMIRVGFVVPITEEQEKFIDDTFDIAIKALEREPMFIAKSDGTIEQIKNCDDCLYKREWEKIGKLIKVVLEKQTEQEPKTGHWICTIEDWNKWTCSECGFCKRTDIHVSLGYNYCPNCGAKMESENKK